MRPTLQCKHTRHNSKTPSATHTRSTCAACVPSHAAAAAAGGSSGSSGSSSRSSRCAAAAASSRENPDLDEIVLDDEYYAEIGMTRGQAMRQQREILYSVDPEATPLGLDSLSTINPDVLPEDLRRAVESIEVYGPQALILAGFRAEEYAVIRASLDSLGAQQVKVLPVSDDMLTDSVELALRMPEVDWSAPRPQEWIRGGTWGSQRTVLFSGLSIKAQATLLELLEAQGLPLLCVTMATKDDAHRQLGEVMAEAVKAQRGYRPQPITPWEINRGTPAQPPRSSSSSKKAAAKPWVPGKKGRLFEKKGSGSSGSGAVVGDGLESLQDLIPPEVARARLKFAPNIGSSSGPRSQTAQQQQQQQQWQQQQQQRAPPPPPPQTDDAEEQPAKLPDASASDQELLDWFNNELGGTAVELPWTEDDDSSSSGGGGRSAAAAAVAAAGLGFEQASQVQQQEGDFSLDDVFAAAGQGSPAASNPSSSNTNSTSSSSSSLLGDLFPDGRPAAAGGGRSSNRFLSEQRQQQQQLTTDQGFVLDDVDPDEGGSKTSVLSVIQSALKSGVSPEQLKAAIDAAAAEAAAADDEVDLLLNADAAKAAAAAALAGPQQQQQQQQQQRPQGPAAAASKPQQPQQVQQYGPKPPTQEDAAEGLVSLHPEVHAAFENKQVKFVDLSRLPKKYKQRYSMDALRQQRQQQQERAVQAEQAAQQQQEEQEGQPPKKQQQQRWWQQQSKRQQLARNLPASVLGNLPPGGRVVKVDMGSPEAAAAAAAAGAADIGFEDSSSSGSSWAQPLYDVSGMSSSGAPGQFFAEQGFEGGDWGEGFVEPPPGSGQYDADFTDRTAAAAADGRQQEEWVGEEEEEEEEEEPLVLDEVKLQQLVESTRLEGLDVSRALAEALAFGVQIDPAFAAAVGVELPPADAVEAAREGIVAAIRGMQEQQQPAAAAAAGEPQEEAGAQSSGGAGGGRGRAWGAGLTAAAQRTKARRSSSNNS